MTSLIKRISPKPKKNKIELKTESGLPVGVAQVVQADGSLALAFDPGFTVPTAKALVKKKQKQDAYTSAYGHKLPSWADWRPGNSWGTLGATTGRYSQKPIDWSQVRAQWQSQTKWDPMYLNMPRYSTKTFAFDSAASFDRMKAAFLGFGTAVGKTKTGLETLREANDEWVEKVRAAEEQARLAITDERVYTFMEQNYLPEHYARKLLEEAYKDSILNEGITNAGS